MQGVQNNIESGWNQCARDAKQSGAARPQPRRTDLLRDVGTLRPARRQDVHVQLFQGNLVTSGHAQQNVVRRDIVRTGVDTRFQQSAGRGLRKIHYRCSAFVPATWSAQSACSLKVAVLADAPERPQMNIPSSIWTRSSSTIRLPVSVLAISRGVRLRNRGFGRRSQASARSREP